MSPCADSSTRSSRDASSAGEKRLAARLRRLAAPLRAAGVRPPARILDAGCGTGNYARALARRGYRVVGVDRSARLLADARAKGAGAGLVFVRADLTTYRPGAPFAG